MKLHAAVVVIQAMIDGPDDTETDNKYWLSNERRVEALKDAKAALLIVSKTVDEFTVLNRQKLVSGTPPVE